MPRSLIILRFLTATARCPSNAPAACSTVPGRCKRLLAAGRNDILGCDDAAGRCGVPTPGGPAAPSELRRGGRSLDACPPGTTLTLPRPPRGEGPRAAWRSLPDDPRKEAGAASPPPTS